MRSWNQEKNNIIQHYRKLNMLYGQSPRASDYGTAESQLIKFKTLSDVCDLADKSILDIGCGYASYYKFLLGQYKTVSYTGFDIVEDCIKAAANRFPGLDVRLIDIMTEDIGERFDVVTANGIFYLFDGNPELKMFNLIEKMFSLSNYAVAFNSLSSWCDDKCEGEFHANPVEVFDFCKKLTPWLSIRHEYHSRDFSVFLYKERQS